MSEEYQLGPWSLEELFPSIEADEVSAAMEELDASVKSFEAYREKLVDDIEEKVFIGILDHYDEIAR